MPKIRNTSPSAISLVMKDGSVETIKPTADGEPQSVGTYDAENEHNKQFFAAGVFVLDGEAAASTKAPRKAAAKRARKG